MESQDTPGTRWLNEHNALYTLCPFHREQGSDQSITKQVSDKLGLDENLVCLSLSQLTHFGSSLTATQNAPVY